jgi:single-strand DNA-binding protein
MLNKIFVCGRMTAAPELKQTPSGVDVCTFTIAVDRDYKNGDEKVCDFFSVTCWRGTAKFVSKFFDKGRMALIEGNMQSRKWTDKEGNNRVSWEVQAQNVYFADSKRNDDGQQSKPQTFEEVASDDDEALPF